MLGYLDGINRFLNDVGIQIDIRRSPVFNHKQDGFMTALDNIVKEQQSQGNLPTHRNQKDMYPD